MRLFIKILGYGWALLGFLNIISMPWTQGNTTLLTAGIIFNTLIFLFPGIVVGLLANIGKSSENTITVTDKLKNLDLLLESGSISKEEHEQARIRIVSTQ